MGLHDADKLAVAEPDGEGPIQAFLAATAVRLGLWVVGGTIALKVPGERRVAAACTVYDAGGARVARYDKIHLFDVEIPGRRESYRESANMAPGTTLRYADTPLGRVGLAVCYDVRFPELFRALGAQGVEGFVLPSAFTAPTGRAHWETLLRARAIENLSFRVGVRSGRRAREWPRDVWRQHDRRPLGTGARPARERHGVCDGRARPRRAARGARDVPGVAAPGDVRRRAVEDERPSLRPAARAARRQ